MSVHDLFSLHGQIAIVTGALGLIGKNHCLALAEAGATVIACDIDGQAAQEFAAELPVPGLGMAIDVTNPDSIRHICNTVLEKYGHIDVLVNNAAINDMVENPAAAAEMSRFENYPLDLWKKVMDVNVNGVFLCSQIFGSIMAQQPSGGSIINIASTYGVVAPNQSIYRTPDGIQPFYKSPVYPASKGAVIMLTRFMASYWGRSGVRVNTLSPGGVQNNQPDYFIENYAELTPMGRMAAPTDYKGAIVFLASRASSYMTGANLLVDGGWTCW
jgi:NAD(P)-dependent dehydrogenase (short-subunit alcohol dehydrogenase family)